MQVKEKLHKHLAASLLCLFSMAFPALADDGKVDLNPTPQAAPLQGGISLEDKQEEKPRKILFTFRSRQALSAEDYRKMEYGVLGIVGQKSIFSRYYTVTHVLPDCPAAQAGVQVGDIQMQAGDHVFTDSDSQGTYWRTMCGKAGTPVDIVVKRGEELLTFHLVRMNIEDIQNERIRRMYEQMLSLFGPPGQN